MAKLPKTDQRKKSTKLIDKLCAINLMKANMNSKTNNPNDSSFEINSLIGSLAGGAQGQAGGFDLQGIVSRFSSGGLDTDGDGQVELSDIISKVTGGAQQQQQTQANDGGGVMDIIKGFMK